MKYFLCAVIAYVLGSLSFSIILSRRLFGADVRSEGSGNAGATNMARSFGKKAGAFTLAGDVIKASAAMLIGKWLAGRWGVVISGLSCLIGHCWPVFFGFKGGKGVSVGLAIAFAAGLPTGFCALAAFLVTMALSKKVSLSSVCACAVAGLGAFIFDGDVRIRVLMVFAAALIIARHHENLGRLLTGTEGDFHFAGAKEKNNKK